MKTAAKVFIILGMILQFWYIIPLIVGIIALRTMKKQKPSVGLSIVVLLFCNTIAGILLLCSKEEEYIVPAPAEVPVAPEAPAVEEKTDAE